MLDDDPKYFRAEIFKIIKKQIRNGTPPETRQTYDRLIAEGYSHDDIMKYWPPPKSKAVFLAEPARLLDMYAFCVYIYVLCVQNAFSIRFSPGPFRRY